MVIKSYVYAVIPANPSRYGIDNGDLNLINDYFVSQGWEMLTREQHTAIAAVIRHRNYFLQANERYDLRTKRTACENVGQLSIYDFLDDETASQSKRLIRYWTTDPGRFDQSPSRIKKSVRGVDTEHIVAAKIMFPLLASNPPLKPKRRRRKTPEQRTVNAVFDGLLETDREMGA